MRPLWEATRDLHHACEAHPVGAAMASGTPPMQWYADWLQAIRVIHDEIDFSLPKILRRSERLAQDVDATGMGTDPVDAAREYADSLDTPDKVAGAAYVLTGAHLMGGEIMRRRLDGYPVSHLEWADRPAAIAELKSFRERPELAEQARQCFSALLKIMDQIKDRPRPTETHMNTTASAHQRLDRLEPKIEQIDRDVSALKAEVHIQFKETFLRVKRIEAILIAASGSIILMLVGVLMKMG